MRAFLALLLAACSSAPRPLPGDSSGSLRDTLVALTLRPAQRDFQEQFEADVQAAGMKLGPGGLSVLVEIGAEDQIVATVDSPGGSRVFAIAGLSCTSTLGDPRDRLGPNMRCLARELAARMIESPDIHALARSTRPPAPIK